MSRNDLVTADAWVRIRSATSARIALGRVGGSLPTSEWLRFRADHAAARDAVHNAFDAEGLATQLEALGATCLIVDSLAEDRTTYLQRPDLGRLLSEDSVQRVKNAARDLGPGQLVVVVSDGLSASAAERQAPPLLTALLPRLKAAGWQLAPIVIARFGRVALEDQIGELISAELALMLIGERPGLGSPDSLGAYLVHGPRVGNTDASRNCVSNIRPEGLAPAGAAETLFYLLTEARARRLSGVHLKDERIGRMTLPDAARER